MSFNNQPPSGGVPPGGTTGEVLVKLSNADGDADWGPVSGTSVTSVNALTGVVVLDTDDIAEDGSPVNLWFTDARAKAAAVADAIVNGVTDVAPSQNAVFDALTLKQDAFTGSFNSLAGFDGTGEIYSVPDYLFNTTTRGFSVNIAQNFINNESDNLHSFTTDLNPTANAPDTGRVFWQLYANIDANDDGFQFGTNGTALNMITTNVNHQGESDVGNINLINQNFNMGNGTDAITVGGIGYCFGFGSVNANVTVDGPVQGYGFQPNVNASATLTASTYFTAFYDSTIIACALNSSYTSFTSSPTIASLGNTFNYNGLQINPTITSFVGTGSVTAISVGGNYGTMNTNSNWNGLQVNPTITQARYAAGVTVFMDNVTAYPGVQSSLVFQDLTFTWILPGDNNAYTMEYTPGGTAGSEVVTISGNAITVQIDSGVSTATQVKAALEGNSGFNSAITVAISGTGSNAQVTAGPTNFVNGENVGQIYAGYFDGDVYITGALSFNGALSVGKLSAFATQALVSGTGNPESIHTLITQPTVAANATLTNADLLGVNTAALINIGDNATVTTAFIGVSALGLPAVLTMGAGSTVDKVSGAAFALSLDAGAGGGTVDTVALCRALAIPNGVTTVNRLYGYEMALPFGDPGTLTWGLYIDNAPNNWLSGSLKIGGTAGSTDLVTNSSIELELTSKALRLATMDTTARNALTPLAGMVIFNTTTSAMEYYDGSAWV